MAERRPERAWERKPDQASTAGDDERGIGPDRNLQGVHVPVFASEPQRRLGPMTRRDVVQRVVRGARDNRSEEEGCMRLLVVEDEPRLASSLRTGLEAEGFAVDIAADGAEGLWFAREHEYDAILLDLMLPVVDGYGVCTTLRDEGNWTPILMLTARDGASDQ